MTLATIAALLAVLGLSIFLFLRLQRYKGALGALRRQVKTGETLSSRVSELDDALGPLREKLDALQSAQVELKDLGLQLQLYQWLLNAFGSDDDADTLIQEALALSPKWFSATLAVYLKYDPDQRGFVFAYTRGDSQPDWTRSIQMTVSASPFLLKRVYGLRDPAVFRRGEEETSVLFGPGAPDYALVGFVRRSGNQFGLVVAYVPENIPAKSPLYSRFEQFVRHISAFLDYSRIGQEMEHRLADLEAIHQVHLQIGSMRDFRDVLEASVESVARALAIEIGMLELIEDDELVMTACSGVDNWRERDFGRLRIGESLSGWVAERNQPLAVENMEQDPRFKFKEAATQLGFKSYIGAPLRVAGRVIGVLSAVALSPRRFSPGEVELLNTLAGSLGVYVEQTRTYHNLQDRLWSLERQVANLKEYSADLEASFRSGRQFEHTKSEIQAALIRDLRESFTVLAGAAEISRQQVSPSAADEVRNWVRQARNTLNQLQEVTRVRAGALSFDLVRADPTEILRKVLKEVTGLMEASGVRLTQETGLPGGTIHAHTDRRKLQEAASGIFRYLLKIMVPGDEVSLLLDWYTPSPSDAGGIVGGSYIRLLAQARVSSLSDPAQRHEFLGGTAALPPDLFLARSLMEIQGGGVNFEAAENSIHITLWLGATLEKTVQEAPAPPPIPAETTAHLPRMTMYIYAPEPNPAFTEFLVQRARNWSLSEFKARDDLFQRCRAAPPDSVIFYGSIGPELLKVYSALNQVLPHSIPFLAVNPQFTRVLGASRLSDALLMDLNGASSFSFDPILRRISSPAALQSLLKSLRAFPVVIVYDFPLSDQILRSLNELLQSGSVVLLGDSESHHASERLVRSLWTLSE
jgi:GAF domain-containing protein